MESTIILILTYIVSIGVLVYGIYAIEDNRARWLHVLMMCCFMAPRISDFPIPLWGTWIKHGIFYVGQLFFFLFIRRVIAVYNPTPQEIDAPSSQQPFSTLAVVAGAQAATSTSTTSVNWMQYLTQQGMQHILGLPIFFMIASLIRVQYAFIASALLKSVLNKMLLAAFCLTMLHVTEFTIESQHWFPLAPEVGQERIEHLWHFAAQFVFALTYHHWPKLKPLSA